MKKIKRILCANGSANSRDVARVYISPSANDYIINANDAFIDEYGNNAISTKQESKAKQKKS